MARKLHYFDLRGLGEGIRYILHYGELDFEDIRYSREEWPKHKETLCPPFGKLPMYEEGDVILHQSSVIARYIGRQLDLVPTDPQEEAKVDSVIHTMFDFFDNIKEFFKETDEEKKEVIKAKVMKEHVVYYYTKFDKQLAENKGTFGKKLSWADIVFVAMTETINDVLKVEIEKDYKNIAALMEKVHNLKGIKTYLQNKKN